ncbi:aspartate/glutamate racemase family protein [Lederbergia wuyishanensis]|uniref:Aspartate racemase n=1 Tax=Lederbergia wuyishanensis TaxID=1347903 RepID=A0ABU0D0C0_9BACI|nr:amino acid racemase [Lederbergia wuyishanensis]MCJ8006481.1 amino acid racemase [Lederbergia wuyishanensis]MDQ0341857.1 aspartate racemase [Lederbergia wuyishanensis]
MSAHREKIVGLLGGMGPEATIDIYQKITEYTFAEKDEDHLRIIIDSNPKMPSRQDAILLGTENPGPAMAQTARNLERAGADVIIICANTAHYYYDYVNDAVGIKVLHIIEETVNNLIESNINKVGVLATMGAMKTGIFQKSLDKQNLNIVLLPDDLQKNVHEAIFSFKYHGKNTENVKKIKDAADSLVKSGAEAVIMGCTEIPIILSEVKTEVPLIDPNEIIAKQVVKIAKYK